MLWDSLSSSPYTCLTTDVRERITKLGRLTEPKLLATAHAVADPEDGTLSPDPEEPQIPDTLPVLGLDEGHLGHRALACLAAHNNIHLGAGFLVAALDVPHGDILAQRGARHAARDDADFLAVLVDLGALASGGSVDVESDASSFDARAALALGCELGDDDLGAVEAAGLAARRIVLTVEGDLKTVLSGVTASADEDGVSFATISELQFSPYGVAKMDFCKINVAGEDFVENLSALRALQGNKAGVVQARPLNVTAELTKLLIEILGVLVETGPIGDNIVSILADSGNNRVIHDTSSAGPQESGQLALHDTLVGPIRGSQLLEERSRVFALEDVLHHVANVKERGMFAGEVTSNIVTGNGEHLLIIIPRLSHDFSQLPGNLSILELEDFAGVLCPKDGVSVRGRPSKVARLQLGYILIERGLGLGILLEHFLELGKVIQQIGVGEVATADVLKKGRKASKNRGR
ncbi:hypothetical protein HG530_005212 [Fusarium avenaceum]|nr:hypothetical protein HG530_005212 [Fusarium avenaceum]